MEALALSLAGIIAPFIVNFIKNATGWEKSLAVVLTIVVSFALAVAAVFATGGAINWKDLTTVFAIATAVYHFFMRK